MASGPSWSRFPQITLWPRPAIDVSATVTNLCGSGWAEPGSGATDIPGSRGSAGVRVSLVGGRRHA